MKTYKDLTSKENRPPCEWPMHAWLTIPKEDILKNPNWKNEALKAFKNSVDYPYHLYILCVHFNMPIPEFEEIIAEDTRVSVEYSRQIIKGKLPEYMHNRMLAAIKCCALFLVVIGKSNKKQNYIFNNKNSGKMTKTTRFTKLPKLYKILKTMADHDTIIHFINNHKTLLKDPKLESNLFDLFQEDTFLLVKIAVKCFKKRCMLFESAIINNPHNTYDYFIHIMKGRLPDDMHNMMIADYVRDPDGVAGLYFANLKAIEKDKNHQAQDVLGPFIYGSPGN